MNDRVVDIFVAFARDSETLVAAMKREIEQLNIMIGVKRKISFKIHDWKTCCTPGWGNPEQVIMEQLPMSGFCIFVGVFRYKFGTPTGNINPETGEPFGSGMEEEFYYANRVRKIHKKLEIMIFKSAEDTVPRSVALEDDLNKIECYFEEFKPGGKTPAFYKEFKSEEEFAQQFRLAIFRYFMDLVEKEYLLNIPRIGNDLKDRGYINIFTNEDNDQRNALKKDEIKNTKTLRLHAKSGHAFLARGIVFNSDIRSALKRGMEFKVIMQNPWSLNSLYLSLNRDEFSSSRKYNDYLHHKMDSKEIIEIFENSHWYKERFLLCINGYIELRKEFPRNIVLKVCDMDASNSIFLSDEKLFFEPYINTVRAGQKALSLFEVQTDCLSGLYQDADEYFQTIWKSSYSFTDYTKNIAFFKNQLERVLDEKRIRKAK